MKAMSVRQPTFTSNHANFCVCIRPTSGIPLRDKCAPVLDTVCACVLHMATVTCIFTCLASWFYVQQHTCARTYCLRFTCSGARIEPVSLQPPTNSTKQGAHQIPKRVGTHPKSLWTCTTDAELHMLYRLQLQVPVGDCESTGRGRECHQLAYILLWCTSPAPANCEAPG